MLCERFNHVFLIIFTLAFSTLLHAQDVQMVTDMCWNHHSDEDSEEPIILFLFDDSHSMKYVSHHLDGAPTPTGQQQRWATVGDAFELTMSSTSNAKIGMVIMGNTDPRPQIIPSGLTEPALGHSYVAYPVTNPSDRDYLNNSISAGEAMLEIIRNNDPEERVPLADLIYEGYQYLTGGAVGGYYRASQDDHVSHPNSYTGGSLSPTDCTLVNANPLLGGEARCLSESISGNPMYISPIADENVKVHIVLVTDGMPNVNYATDEIEALIGEPCHRDASELAPHPEGQRHASCITSFIDWMSEQDLSPLPGKQTATFHTLGIHKNGARDKDDREWPAYAQWLQNLVEPSGGMAVTAQTYTELLDAFVTLGNGMIDYQSREEHLNIVSFSDAAFSLDPNDIFTNGDSVYLNLFEVGPNDRPWYGNLKRYKVKEVAATSDPNGPKSLRIVGANDEPVFNETTGAFNQSVRSYWTDSSVTDGNKVKLGGAASQLPANPLDRKIYSNLNENSNILTLVKGSVTPTHFPGEPTTEFEINKLVNWLYGDDGTGKQSYYMGDPIHPNPVVLNYGNNESTVFFSTNQGLIHAIDGNTGQERYAFIPAELIPNLKKQSGVSSYGSEHIYGMDGPIILAVDNNKPFERLSRSEGDRAILYASMRRGGKSLYALDVTDMQSPRLLWTIQGGVTPGFEKLGQTWSKPIRTKIRRLGDGEQGMDVLIFGGGYDPIQDTAASRTMDTMGNAIFIINAATGQLLWSTSNQGATKNHSDMNYSIPAEITVLDLNQDGFMDQFHVGDMGGQLWSFYVHHNQPTSSLISGGVIADVARNNSRSAHRRFFLSPDVLITQRYGKIQMAIVAGTGGLSKPLDRGVNDALYVVLSDYIYTIPSEADLKNIKDTTFTRSNPNNALAPNVTKWYIDFPGPGEKTISKGTTINNIVFFSTFVPNNNPCDKSLRFKQWLVNLETGLSAQTAPGVTASDPRAREETGSLFVPSSAKFVITEKGSGMFSGFRHIKEGDDIRLPNMDISNPYADKTINDFNEGYYTQQ